MPVPTSGEISLGKIRQELESSGTGDDYNNGPYTASQTSLKRAEVDGSYGGGINDDSTSKPDENTPCSMNE